MKKAISLLALASLFAAGSASASGFRIPEQSVDSTAKVGANVASASRADAAYFNPANMSWMDNAWQVGVNATYLYLSPIDYEDARSPMYNGESEAEHFLIPTGFMVSPEYANFRFGLAIVAPFGLSKQWEDPYPKAFAEEFSLTTIEANPTVSYKVNDMFSVSAGLRAMYADATVRADGRGLGMASALELKDGATVEWGYNVAVSVKPTEDVNLSATYRSQIDLDFDGDADILMGGSFLRFDGKTTLVTPGVLAISASFMPVDKLTVELEFDRTFWSDYEELTFEFSGVGLPSFSTTAAKNWDDANAYRISMSYELSDTLTVMAGFAYDESPVPDETISFELPGSPAYLYGLGLQYKVNENMEIGVSCLYDYKESRTVMVDPTGTVYGELTNASAFLLTVGLDYKF